MHLGDNDNILLAIKLLHTCRLAYYNSHLNSLYATKEQQLIEALGIEEYKVWDSKHIDETTNVETITSQAITGIISNVSNNFIDKIAFISFRGTASYHDVLMDIFSLLPTAFITAKYTTIATSGAGMVHAYTLLRDQGLLKHAIAMSTQYKGLLITGHSLGGALATLLTAELLSDYSNIYTTSPLRLVTFGSPRVFDYKYSKMMDYKYSTCCNYDHYRFINEKDIVTALPFSEFPFKGFLSALKVFVTFICRHHDYMCYYMYTHVHTYIHILYTYAYIILYTHMYVYPTTPI